MLNRKNRIGNRQVIEKLYQKGSLLKDHFLVFKYEKTDSPSQFAITVSKKISKKAIVRNQIKRRLREKVRIELPRLKKGIDGVIIVRPGVVKEKNQEISKNLNKIFLRAKLIRKNGSSNF